MDFLSCSSFPGKEYGIPNRLIACVPSFGTCVLACCKCWLTHHHRVSLFRVPKATTCICHVRCSISACNSIGERGETMNMAVCWFEEYGSTWPTVAFYVNNSSKTCGWSLLRWSFGQGNYPVRGLSGCIWHGVLNKVTLAYSCWKLCVSNCKCCLKSWWCTHTHRG